MTEGTSLSPETVAAQRGPFAGSDGHFDAPYLPTPMPLVERMLDLAGVEAGTRLVDLGCGDGRIVLAAARRGASATGIDIDGERIAEGEAAAAASGLTSLARFSRGDMFALDLSGFDVVTLYLLGHVNGWLEGKMLRELQPGARVVSHAFPMPNWVPAAQETWEGRQLNLWVL